MSGRSWKGLCADGGLARLSCSATALCWPAQSRVRPTRGGARQLKVSCPSVTTVGGHPAIHPEISGRGWITGIHQHMLDPADPWPEGYRLSDTWGAR